MHPASYCRLAARLGLPGGVLVLTSLARCNDIVTNGPAAAASASVSGGGGGSLVELWFVLMLALVGALQWLDFKEAEKVRRRIHALPEDLEHTPVGQ